MSHIQASFYFGSLFWLLHLFLVHSNGCQVCPTTSSEVVETSIFIVHVSKLVPIAMSSKIHLQLPSFIYLSNGLRNVSSPLFEVVGVIIVWGCRCYHCLRLSVLSLFEVVGVIIVWGCRCYHCLRLSVLSLFEVVGVIIVWGCRCYHCLRLSVLSLFEVVGVIIVWGCRCYHCLRLSVLSLFEVVGVIIVWGCRCYHCLRLSVFSLFEVVGVFIFVLSIPNLNLTENWQI